MALLIDGYNLLHVTGIFGRCGRAGGRGSLQCSREALIRFLADSIESKELPRTIVVFDATDAPAGLPIRTNHDGMTVLYAAGYPDADSLIEELIEQATDPRSLLVVSSDHRIQRAARRHRAQFTDSDFWYAQLWRRRHARKQAGTGPPGKPTGPLAAEEVDYWLREFSADSGPIDSDGSEPGPIDSTLSEQEPAPDAGPETEAGGDAPPRDHWLANPFPPGYGEDLLSDD